MSTLINTHARAALGAAIPLHGPYAVGAIDLLTPVAADTSARLLVHDVVELEHVMRLSRPWVRDFNYALSFSFNYKKRMQSSFGLLIQRGCNEGMWTQFLEKHLASNDVDDEYDKYDVEQRWAHAREVVENHGVSWEQFLLERKPIKNNGSALSPLEVYDIFRDAGLRIAAASSAAVLFALRTIDTTHNYRYNLRCSLFARKGVRPGVSIFFDRFAEAMTGSAPPEVAGDTLKATGLDPKFGRLINSIAYYYKSGMPYLFRQQAVYARFLDFYIDEGKSRRGPHVFEMWKGFNWALQGKINVHHIREMIDRHEQNVDGRDTTGYSRDILTVHHLINNLHLLDEFVGPSPDLTRTAGQGFAFEKSATNEEAIQQRTKRIAVSAEAGGLAASPTNFRDNAFAIISRLPTDY